MLNTIAWKFEIGAIEQIETNGLELNGKRSETCYEREMSDLETPSSDAEEEEEEIGRRRMESHRRDLNGYVVVA